VHGEDDEDDEDDVDDEDEEEEVGRSRPGVQDQEDDVFVEACTTKTTRPMKTTKSMGYDEDDV